MATSTTKNPWIPEGVSILHEDPNDLLPIVGQKELFDQLRRFITEDCLAESGIKLSSFFVLHGGWGVGKSRVGHEVCMEAIVAINMVSEGVDMPRIRSVAYCRYTESEMLFRQIAGRATRRTLPNDQHASQLYVPDFPVMREFGERLWDESRQVLKEREDRPAPDPGIPDPDRDPATIVCLDAEAHAGAGHVDRLEVESQFIERGEHLINAHVAFRHYNQVQLGAMLKFDAEYTGRQERFGVSPTQERENQLDRLRRRISKFAGLNYDGNFQEAYRMLFRKFRAKSFEEIRTTWTANQIQDAVRWVEEQLLDEPLDGSTK